MSKINSENGAVYQASKAPIGASDDAIIEKALAILKGRVKKEKFSVTSSDSLANYLRLKIGGMGHEVFGVVLMDNKHRVITLAAMFRGTVDGASVYPREVVKEVLKHNAVAVAFYHNHPSGNAEPSSADTAITTRLKDALALIDVRVLDHFIVTAGSSLSFAETGRL